MTSSISTFFRKIKTLSRNERKNINGQLVQLVQENASKGFKTRYSGGKTHDRWKT